MIKIEDTQSNVLVLSLVDTVDKADIQALEAAFAKKMKDGGKFGLLVDMSKWSDITRDGLAQDAKFEFGLLGKLSAFPKMALVSDKEFVRAGIRFINPLIPTVDARCFASVDYDKALAFASDISDAATPPRTAVTLVKTDDPKLIAFTLSGMITKADVDCIVGPLQAAFDKDEKIDLLVSLKNVSFDPVLLVDPTVMPVKMKSMSHIRRYAIVGAPTWISSVVGMIGGVLPLEVKAFDAGQDDAAMTWLKG